MTLALAALVIALVNLIASVVFIIHNGIVHRANAADIVVMRMLREGATRLDAREVYRSHGVPEWYSVESRLDFYIKHYRR